ncbi:MAG: hypothetical protein ACOYXR_13470 [Nitrospirota bacterium]
MTRLSRVCGALALPVLLAAAPVLAAPMHMQSMAGQVRKVDTITHTLTVASLGLQGRKDQAVTFHVVPDAKVTRNGQNVPVGELKEGDQVTIQYATEKGEHMAHSIALKGAEAEPAKLGK